MFTCTGSFSYWRAMSKVQQFYLPASRLWCSVRRMKKYTFLMISLIAFVGCDQKPTTSADSTAKKKPAAEAAKKADEKPAAKAATPAAKPATPAAKPATPAAKPAAKTGLAAPSATAGLPAPADVAAAPADAVKTASGLASKVLKKGTGAKKPAKTDTVKVHYTGWTTDGKMFDSSVMRGQPASFALNQVIPGWTEGVALMVVGEKRRFWIPGKLAYGDTPKRPGAPAGTLVFDVELLDIEKPQSPEEAKKQFEAFLTHITAGGTKICACKDMSCASKTMMEMQQVPPPKGRPTPEQIQILMPHMQKLDQCWKKLQAAAQPPVPAAPGTPKSAPANPAKK